MASSDNLNLNNVDFEMNNAFLSTPLSEWIQTEINEINNAFSALPIIEWLQTEKSRACLRYGYRVFYRKARHNGNGNEFRCSTPGCNAAIWLKLDSVNFAESMKVIKLPLEVEKFGLSGHRDNCLEKDETYFTNKTVFAMTATMIDETTKVQLLYEQNRADFKAKNPESNVVIKDWQTVKN